MPTTKTKSRTLTVEFSGICTLVWNKKAGTADVHMVDLASAGFERHYAALGLAVGESTARGVRGPDADAAISVPGEQVDIGLWNLFGTTTEVIGATGKLTIDDSKVDPTKKPSSKPGSIRWLPDIGFLCESTNVDPVCPTAAIFRISAGHLTSAGGAFARKVQFVSDGEPVGPDRYCVPRFQVTIPFDRTLALRLDRTRVLRFTESQRVIVSNTCVCGLGMATPANHFYGHYDVVDAKRRPTVAPAPKQAKFPWWPEMCNPGFVQLGGAS
jgi:hypothetical protein